MNDNGARVTTREFYDALLKQNDKMDNMEQRILARLDKIVDNQITIKETIRDNCADIEHLESEVDYLKKRDIIAGGITGTFAVIAAAVAGYLGVNR